MLLNKIFPYLLVFFLLSCSDNKIHQEEDFIFGTIISIKVYGEPKIKSEKVSNEIFNEFHRLHKLLHPWKKSLITDINIKILNNESISLNNDEIISILKEAQYLEKKTQGLFNPAIGKLIELWGFHKDDYNLDTMPNQVKIKNLLLSKPSMQSLTIKNKILKSNNRDVQIDLGGFAKGYALDQAKKILLDNNIKNALINIGGNIIAFGKHGDRDWIVGIQNPRKPNTIATINLKSGWSIGTSGDYQRYIIINNQRYSHLINPKIGYPENKTQSATILIPPSKNSGTLSDVLSKPLFIAKEKDKIKLANSLNIDNFLIIMENGSILISESMNKDINWEDGIDKKNIKIY